MGNLIWKNYWRRFSSVQFSCSVVSDSLQPHELQHARPPCPSPTPGAYSNSCPLSQWCHPTISSSHPLLLLPSVFPSIRVFSNEPVLRIRWLGIGVSASASVLPMNIQDWFPSGLIGWISLQSKGLSRIFPNTTGVSARLFVIQRLRACVMLIYETKALQWILGKVALETVGLLVLTIADTSRWWLQPWN